MSDDVVTDYLIRKRAARMDVFCDGDTKFVLGEFRAWEAACMAEGRDIPPGEWNRDEDE